MGKLTAFTETIKDGMRVRHDAQARITVKTGKKVLDDHLTSVESIGGAITVASITYNRLAGTGISWWNPTTGEAISRPKVSIRVRPEDILTGDALCACAHCLEGEDGS